MALEGVLATILKAGANCRKPSLEMATPCAVPLRNSSYLDCSQVRVPSAKTAVRAERKRMSRTAELRSNIVASGGKRIVETRVSRRTFGVGPDENRDWDASAARPQPKRVPYFLSDIFIPIFAIGFEPPSGTMACSYGVPAHII